MQEIATTQNQNEPYEGTNYKSRNAAKALISDILNSNAVVFYDQRNETYIAWHGDGRQILKIDSTEFSEWLFYRYWVKVQQPLPRDADKQVIKTLSAHARYEGQSHDLFVRLAKKGNALYYDLADSRVVKITSDGWGILNTPEIMFRRIQQKSQVLPERDGVLGTLRNYINVASEEDWLLFMVFTIAAFIPGFPHPMLVLHGPQGAGKTTPMKVVKQLVDPSVIQGMPMPADIKSFVLLADQHAFLFFDNLSGLTTKMSDTLARAITGDTLGERKLYSNNDLVVYSIQNPIAINGINQVVVKADLLDRAILIELRRISKEARTPEDEFWSAFNHDKPGILGAIFDVLVKAIAIYPTVSSENLPRMADFSRWGCAIAEAAGYNQQDFLEAYAANIARQNDEAIDASPISKAIIRLLDESDDGTWQGSPENLYDTLNRRSDTINWSKNPLWPKSPEYVTRRLHEAQVNLQEIGIKFDEYRNSKGRLLVLTDTKRDVELDELNNSTPNEPQQQLDVNDDDNVSMSATSQV